MSKLNLPHNPQDLAGKALKDAAAALDIPGRSTMKAHELRAAVYAVHDVDEQEDTTEPFALPDPFNDLDEEIADDFENGAVIPSPFPPQLSMPEECAEAEQVIEIPTFELENPEHRRGPLELNQMLEAAEDEEWTVVPNREERRKAARRQKKAAGRIAQKHNRQN